MPNIKIEKSWKEALAPEFEKDYFKQMVSLLREAKDSGKVIYPPGSLIFNAFNISPFDKVKIVVLGQDPYHGSGQAMGLSFSVPRGVRTPPSLVNIYKELYTDLQIPLAVHGDLTAWAEQGVFLLNAMLTVEHKKAGSHQKIGWQDFTNAVIRTLSEKRENLIFMLWGNFAKQKKELIDGNKHLILEAAHPSPLARGAYFGSKHFSKANAYLKQHGMLEIDWRLPL